MLFSLGLVAQEAIDPGQAYFNQGNFEKAVEYWDAALSNILPEENPKRYIDMSLRLAAAYQALGRMLEAYKLLSKAHNKLSLCKKGEQCLQIRAKILMRLSDFYVEMRHFNKDRGSCAMKDVVDTVISNKELGLTPKDMLDSASKYIDKALVCLSKVNTAERDFLLEAKILNRKGNILFLQSKLEVSSLNRKGKWSLFESGNSSNETTKLKCADDWKTCYRTALKNLPANNDKADMLRVKIELNLLQAIIDDSNVDDSNSIDDSDKEKSKAKLDKLNKLISNLPASHDKNFALISLAQLTKKLFYNEDEEVFYDAPFDKGVFDKERRLFVYTLLNNALKAAKEQQDRRSRIYALFELAKLYGLDKRYQDSFHLLREAIFYARNYPPLRNECQQQLWGYPNILYRLEWTLAKYLKKQQSTPKEHTEAIENAYENAANHIDDMEDRYTVLPEGFHTEKERLFFEYADILLKKAHQMQEKTYEQKAKKQKALKDAIKVIESSKVAEVKDYLQDSCLTKELEDQVEHLDDNLPDNVAIFYPLLFEDRIESLMVTKEYKIKQDVHEHIGFKKIKQIIEKFRRDASFNGNNGSRYKITVYDWFSRSLERLKSLKGIDTIVIVPHGKLYTIPFAVLSNDKATNKPYLIEKYALNITPSIRLTNIKKLSEKHSSRILVSGVSIVKDENLSRLCHAATEIMSVACAFQNQPKKIAALNASICLGNRTSDCNKNKKLEQISNSTYYDLSQCLKSEKGLNIGKCMPNTNVLLEQDFTIEQLKNVIRENDFSNIHISTHGKFQNDSKSAFLYTSDGKNITMPELRSVISKKGIKDLPYLDLLVLSACQTAIGKDSERSALGFASAAISAGTSSVLGTLWPVHEETTKDLITDFYTNLYSNSEQYTKAKALQKAIQKLIGEGKEPYYWAPFVMIGNGYK